MRKAGALTAQALHAGGAAVRPGVTTAEIDHVVHDFITRHGAVPSFLGYGGFPASACISVNDEVIHGIPGGKVIREGDIVSIDVGAKIGGYHGDSACTFPCGRISDGAQSLLDATKLALEKGIAAAQPGSRIGDVAHAVQSTVEPLGFSVVREYVGHGVGRDLHEEPEVPNFGHAGHGIRLVPGMVIAIEPMITMGTEKVDWMSDGWTVKTKDRKPAAHYENTIAITDNGVEILSL